MLSVPTMEFRIHHTISQFQYRIVCTTHETTVGDNKQTAVGINRGCKVPSKSHVRELRSLNSVAVLDGVQPHDTSRTRVKGLLPLTK